MGTFINLVVTFWHLMLHSKLRKVRLRELRFRPLPLSNLLSSQLNSRLPHRLNKKNKQPSRGWKLRPSKVWSKWSPWTPPPATPSSRTPPTTAKQPLSRGTNLWRKWVARSREHWVSRWAMVRRVRSSKRGLGSLRRWLRERRFAWWRIRRSRRVMVINSLN